MVNTLAHIAMFGAFAGLLWFPVILVVTLVTPKILLNKYFKQPHFNAGELIVFGSFPGFFMRTALFCRLYLTPKAVKGRNLDGFVEDSPKWYRMAVLSTYIGFITHGLIVLICTGIVWFAIS